MLKNEYTDQKIQLESKEDMKKRLWRSPDIADSIMMRMYYEVCWLWNEEIEWETVSVDIWKFLLW
jgi:sugar-specific transcriptional regulator TrmB